MTELKASLETIQTTAKELITEIEGHFTELQQQRQAEQEQGDTFSIYQLSAGTKQGTCALSLMTVCKRLDLPLTG